MLIRFYLKNNTLGCIIIPHNINKKPAESKAI